MAKRKTKRKKPTKSVSRRTSGPFWADALLAILYLLKLLFVLASLLILASFGFGMEQTQSVKSDILKRITEPDVIQQINAIDPLRGGAILAVAVGILPLGFLFLRGIWRAKKWAFLLTLLEQGISIALFLLSTENETRIGAALPIIVLVFALLRLAGAIGPKMK